MMGSMKNEETLINLLRYGITDINRYGTFWCFHHKTATRGNWKCYRYKTYAAAKRAHGKVVDKAIAGKLI